MSDKKSKCAFIICGEGGHLEQARIFLKSVTRDLDWILITENDTDLSRFEKQNIELVSPVSKYTKNLNIINNFNFIISVARLIFRACYYLYKYKPSVIVNLGPFIGLPFLAIATFLNVRTVHIETRSRFQTISRSGKIAYYFSKVFFVQNPTLLVLNQKFKYVGRLEDD